MGALDFLEKNILALILAKKHILASTWVLKKNKLAHILALKNIFWPAKYPSSQKIPGLHPRKSNGPRHTDKPHINYIGMHDVPEDANQTCILYIVFAFDLYHVFLCKPN